MTVLYNRQLPVDPEEYAASNPLMVSGGRLMLLFEAVVTTPGPLDFYLEYTDEDPSVDRWYREVAEEDSGGGVTEMPYVVRTWRGEGSPVSDLPAGTHRAAMPFVRTGVFVRVRARMRSGSATLQIRTPGTTSPS